MTNETTARLIEARDMLIISLSRWCPHPSVQRRIDSARLAEIKRELLKRGVR